MSEINDAVKDVPIGEWRGVLLSQKDTKPLELSLEEPRDFLIFDYAAEPEVVPDSTLVFSRIGKDESTKTAWYFKNWQREKGKIVLDLFEWGDAPIGADICKTENKLDL